MIESESESECENHIKLIDNFKMKKLELESTKNGNFGSPALLLNQPNTRLIEEMSFEITTRDHPLAISF